MEVPDNGHLLADQQNNHPSLGENEEEYLRSTWGKLGVGKDGYLDQTQLALVCECIGMEKLSDEVSFLRHSFQFFQLMQQILYHTLTH